MGNVHSQALPAPASGTPAPHHSAELLNSARRRNSGPLLHDTCTCTADAASLLDFPIHPDSAASQTQGINRLAPQYVAQGVQHQASSGWTSMSDSISMSSILASNMALHGPSHHLHQLPSRTMSLPHCCHCYCLMPYCATSCVCYCPMSPMGHSMQNDKCINPKSRCRCMWVQVGKLPGTRRSADGVLNLSKQEIPKLLSNILRQLCVL